MQKTLFQKFSKSTFAELHKQEIQKQINKMKKKTPKKRIRLNVECHSMAEKIYFTGVIERAKKNLKKK